MIKIQDTLSNKLQELKTINKDKVNMYVCGPTVYNNIHIGNARPIIFFDTVRRYLEYKGYEVKYVQNFTDIDDKMIKKANEEETTVKKIAEKYINEYFEDTKSLNLKEESTIHPKATENISEMIQLVKVLEEKGYAYAVNGNVYYRVNKFEGYGKLSHQKIENLKTGARIEENKEKENPSDFTLWKKAKENEPSWNSPWGEGRPGWHLECSVMSKKYLGETIDIHGGGQDLIFPHHENEIAQSEASSEKTFVNNWMHNGYLNINGEKMSKSEGNFFMLKEITEKYDGRILRFFMLSSHYRTPIEFSEEEIKMAEKGLSRIETTLIRIKEKLIESNKMESTDKSELENILLKSEKKFFQSMDTDFNTAKAFGAIFELVKGINKHIEEASNIELEESFNFIKKVIEDILGIKLSLENKMDNDLSGKLLEYLLEIRSNAKKEKNWKLADEIRDKLKDMGIEIKDGKEKTTWTLIK